MSTAPFDLSIVIPALNEERNVSSLLAGLRDTTRNLGIRCELLVIDGGSRDRTAEIAQQQGARVVVQKGPGYGSALKTGFAEASGQFILTLDADFSHDPAFLCRLWDQRQNADLIVASRYILGGNAEVSWGRRLLSRLVNIVFSKFLALPVQDVSSGFRLYRRSLLDSFVFSANGYDAQIEILLRALGQGWRLAEVPFHYKARRFGASHVRFFQFGWVYARAMIRFWKLRNSVYCADYDLRAFNSAILPQRWWQRRRYRVVSSLCGKPASLMDVGCGTGKFILGHPEAVAVDLSLAKLRYLRSTHRKLIRATAGMLPFRDQAFDCVVCSEVIEHTLESPFREFWRVLRPGGRLIVSTPDYGRWRWRFIEWIYGKACPGGYACEHVTHYTSRSLRALLDEAGFSLQEVHYVFGADLIALAIRKPSVA